MHQRDQEEETDEKHRFDMVDHILFKYDKPVVYRLFCAYKVRQRNREKTNALTLTVLSNKFSECLGLRVPFTMLSRVDVMLGYVGWILVPYGSTS